jgi:integrase
VPPPARDHGTLAELLDPPPAPKPPPLTLGAFLDTWLQEVARIRVSPNTLTDYKQLLARHVRPTLGDMPLAEIGPEHVQAVYNHMRDAGLSGRTVRYVHTLLSAALNKAVRWGKLPVNPALETDRPPQRRVRQIQVFAPEEAVRFLEAAEADPLGALFAFALGTGARPEEYAALEWSVLDLERATARIERVVVWAKAGGGYSFAEPKTAASRRTLDLQPQLVVRLREHKRRQLLERLQRGVRFRDQGLVFPNTEGSPVMRRNLYGRHMVPILERAGLPRRHTLYSLRHSFATLSLAAGADVKHISAALGHKSVAFTLDTYTSALPRWQVRRRGRRRPHPRHRWAQPVSSGPAEASRPLPSGARRLRPRSGPLAGKGIAARR